MNTLTDKLNQAKIISYTRDHVNGKTIEYHLKDTANTIHSKTTHGNTCQYVLNPDDKKSPVRKLTPTECFRLQGLDDEAIAAIDSTGISDTQKIKLAGNSICVDVLYHIFKALFIDEAQSTNQQLTLF
jgi:site-specific DNA-cytosine methylase